MKDNKIDVIILELINNFLFSIVDEMTQSTVRTSFSPITRDAFDFQCGLCNADGEMILEGEGTLIHSLLYPTLIRDLLKNFKGSIYPGDIFITNDPYSGAAHLPDVYMMHPIFIAEEKLVAWSVAGGHLRDVGGSVPGSCGCDSTEIYQEGLRIPPAKLYESGVPNEMLFNIIKANTRVPMIVTGDIKAFQSACYIGEKRFQELIKTYGWDYLHMYLDELIDYAERLTRAEIKRLPDGDYEFTDYMDDDGVNPGQTVTMHVLITIEGDTITYDFSRTSPQVAGAINNPLGSTRATVCTCLRDMIDIDIPRNSGTFRPVNLIIPEGNLLNPRLPAACASRGATIGRLVDLILGAEAQIAPEKIPACAAEVDVLLNIGGYDKEGNPFIYMETFWGGWGGRPFSDGVDFNTPPFLNSGNQPCETNEEDYPVMYKQFGYVQDTEGAGKYRGSMAVIREYEFTGDNAILQLRIDRQRFAPYGLYGGKPGALAQAIINPDTENRSIGKITTSLKKGDVLRLVSPGAGGWGNCLERDPKLVLKDVHGGKVSIKRAKDVYGVVIEENSYEIDHEATAKLRNSMSQAK
jgi:N-methylhydantoinase B